MFRVRLSGWARSSGTVTAPQRAPGASLQWVSAGAVTLGRGGAIGFAPAGTALERPAPISATVTTARPSLARTIRTVRGRQAVVDRSSGLPITVRDATRGSVGRRQAVVDEG